jgi:hypothetical protein
MPCDGADGRFSLASFEQRLKQLHTSFQSTINSVRVETLMMQQPLILVDSGGGLPQATAQAP